MTAKKITSWSFSRYDTYKQCPLKLKLSAIDRIQAPGNEAMARGSEIHKLAEDYIKSKIRTLPAELKAFKSEFTFLRAQYKKKISGVVVEDTWAFTKDWGESRWDDWINCWVRIKLDCAHHEDQTTLIVTDWKTGKFRAEMNEAYMEQLELYALAALMLYEHIEVVKPRLVYLDHGVIHPPSEKPLIFKRADVNKLKKLWAKRVKPMLSDTVFAPKPNNFCRWCYYRASNKDAGGGQCKF